MSMRSVLFCFVLDEMNEEGQKRQTSSDKTSPEDAMVTTVYNAVLYIWKLLREYILKVLITRKKMFNYAW